MKLFFAYSIFWYIKNKALTALALIGAILGIAVYSSIQASTNALVTSLEESVESLSSASQLQLRSNGGLIPVSKLQQLNTISEIKNWVPKISQALLVRTHNGQAYKQEKALLVGLDVSSQLVGQYFTTEQLENRNLFIDLMADYKTSLVSAALFNTSDSSIEIQHAGQWINLKIIGELSDQGIARAFGQKVILTDIASAQEILNRFDSIDSVDLFADINNRSAIEEKLKAVFGEDVYVTSSAEYSTQKSQITKAFRLNLRFLSFIALIVATMLTYSVMSFLILKRRSDFAILKACGAKITAIFYLILFEALILGVLSGVLGYFLGLFLGEYVSSLASNTAAALYEIASLKTSGFNTYNLAVCILIGACLSVAGFLIPALEASNVNIKEQLYYQTYERRITFNYRKLSYLGIIFLVISILASKYNFFDSNSYSIFIIPLLIIMGFCLITPLIIEYLVITFRFCLGNNPAILLASNHLLQTLRRSAVTVSALGLAFGLVLAITTMITSFRQTVVTWIESITTADLYISAPSLYANRQSSLLPSDFVSWLESQASIAGYDTVYNFDYTYQGSQIRVSVVRFSSFELGKKVLIKSGRLPQKGSFDRQIMISESLAAKHPEIIEKGITIRHSEDDISGEVTAVISDFASEQGVVYVDISQISKPNNIHGASIFLGSQNKNDLIKSLNLNFPDHVFEIRSNTDLQNFVLQIFDQTFKLTWILQACAGLIAILSLFALISMLFTERLRELQLLWAIGANKFTLITSVTIETGLLGFCVGIISVFLGLGLGLVTVFVLNKQLFGWTIDFQLPVLHFVLVPLIIVITTSLCGALPALIKIKAAKINKLRYE